MKKKVVLFPGSFDPITNGHIDIIKRALKIFDEVVVLLAINEDKNYFFNSDERFNLVKAATKNIKGVKVDYYEGYTVDYARQHNISVMVRGIRSQIDFDYEMEINDFNKKKNPNIETIFFFTSKKYASISSFKTIDSFKKGVDITPFVPRVVYNAIKKKL